MNRNQFQTTASQAKDQFFVEEGAYKFNQASDSDSGEDFDYGDEGGEDYGDADIDLI